MVTALSNLTTNQDSPALILNNLPASEKLGQDEKWQIVFFSVRDIINGCGLFHSILLTVVAYL
jgi:hypothetical protein